MARNVEIKARVAGLDSVRRKAQSLSVLPCEVLQQVDTFFTVPHGRLKLRQFADGSGELIAYERADQMGPKESVYVRHLCTSASTLLQTLRRALPLRGTVVKRREVFLVGPTRIHLDQIDDLGCFVELEVVLDDAQSATHGEQIARELLGALQIPSHDLIAESYIDLLQRRAHQAEFK